MAALAAELAVAWTVAETALIDLKIHLQTIATVEDHFEKLAWQVDAVRHVYKIGLTTKPN